MTALPAYRKPHQVFALLLNRDSNEISTWLSEQTGCIHECASLPLDPKNRFEKYLGYKVAAFEVKGYRPRDELVLCHVYRSWSAGRAVRNARRPYHVPVCVC